MEACPPSAAYRLRKFVRKHRGMLSTAAGFVAMLVVATALSAFLAVRARTAEAEARRDRDAAIDSRQSEAEARRRAEAAEESSRIEADKAREINRFLTMDLLSQAEPVNNAAEDRVTLVEVLDRAAEKVDGRFVGQPEVEDALRRAIAETYHGLASWEKAERQWRAVLEAARKRHGPDTAGRSGPSASWPTSSGIAAGSTPRSWKWPGRRTTALCGSWGPTIPRRSIAGTISPWPI